ncbi:MAG: hypothetical protein RLZZ562_1258 [Planctomycetota bacterium]|jgi:anti-sigma regulatory factor (Ser/Thr protein kinase)
MTAKLLLRMLGPMDQLGLCWQAGESLLASVDFGEDSELQRHHVLLALQEMVTNVLRHAYDGDESQPIEVEFSVCAATFAIELRDRGPEFDPLEHDVAKLLEDASMPTAVGGFGIHIARLVMDQVSHARRNGWNILRMEKRVAVRAERKAGDA